MNERPALRGGLLALGAATLFGISTPLVQHAGVGLGPFSTAALLYAGAALVGAVVRRPIEREARLRLGDVSRLAWMALFGAVIGPVALAWGLQHTSGTTASLMLALEALFTALLARACYGESMDRRVWTAMMLLMAGGMVLVLERGATLSLRLYLLAQRAFGAARTGSVFAFAPFIGALLAIALGERGLGVGTAVGGVLMLAGVALHLAESHGHEHDHEANEHEHAHTHDDLHHDHVHDAMPVGPHSHRHRHEAMRHAHPHVPDSHHTHRH